MKRFNNAYLIFFLLFVSVAVYIWKKEASFLVATQRYENPTMIYSSTLQKRFLMDANFISNPYVKANNGKFKCFRPYLKIVHDNNELSDRQYNSCNNVTQMDYWKGFGERLKVRDKYSLVNDSADNKVDRYHTLCYFQSNGSVDTCNKVLDSKSIVLKIQFNNVIKDILMTSKGSSSDSAINTQFVDLVNNQIQMDNSDALAVSQTIIGVAGKNGFTIEKAFNNNSLIISNHLNDSITELECNDKTIDGLPRASVHNTNLTAKVRFWCYASSLEPKTELERVAYQVSQYDSSNHKSPIVSTIRKGANDRLQSILTDSVGRSGVAQAVMMNQKGEILAMVSSKTERTVDYDYIKQDIDNFKNKAPGSMVKPIFAHAVLTKVPELSTLKMSVNGSSDGCKLVDKTIIDGECKASTGFYNASLHYGRLDFKDYIAMSDNVYSSTLLYLGSTIALPSEQFGRCNSSRRWLSQVSDDNFNVNAQCAQSNSTNVTTVNDRNVQCWLANRANTFKESNNISCIGKTVPLWYQYLVDRQKIYTPESPSYDLFESEYNFPSLKFDKSFIINAEADFNQKYTDGPFKWSRGGGESLWSTVGVAENITSILAKRQIKPTLIPVADFRQDTYINTDSTNEIDASDTIIAGMRSAICSPRGTARRLNGVGNNLAVCSDDIATIQTNPNHVQLQVLAKTGTANKNIIDYSSDNNSQCLATAFNNELSDNEAFQKNGHKPLASWCSDDQCNKLSNDGEATFKTIERRFNNKTFNFDQQVTVKEQFISWLKYHHNLLEKLPENLGCQSDGPGVGDDVRRITLAFGLADDQDQNNFNKLCTIVFINDNRGNNSHLNFSQNIIQEMRSPNSEFAKACEFI